MSITSPRDWNLAATWLDELNFKSHTKRVDKTLPRVWVRYDAARAVQMSSWVPQWADSLIAGIGFTQSDAVVIGGVGFGWIVEELRNRGYNVVGLETSTWIWSLANQTETTALRGYITAAGLDPDTGDGAALMSVLDDGGVRMRTDKVLDETPGPTPSNNRIKAALNISSQTDVDHLITFDIMSVVDETTVGNAYRNALTSLGGTVTHWISSSETTRSRMEWGNWKTIDEWKAVFPSDQVQMAGRKVLA